MKPLVSAKIINNENIFIHNIKEIKEGYKELNNI